MPLSKITVTSQPLSMAASRFTLVASQIKKGERFSADNVTAKRPGAGVSPMRWDEVIGQVAQKDYEKDGLI